MSGQFLLKDVGVTQQEKIFELLNLKETVEPNSWKNQTPKNKSKKTINLYSIEDKVLNLPYNFILNQIGIHPNNQRKHDKISVGFEGKLRVNQVEICEKALLSLQQKQTIVLNIYASFGKTVVSAYLSSKLGYKTVILLASDLIKNWVGTINTFIPSAKVWVVESKKTPPAEVDFYICMEGRIDHLPKNHLERIGTLIIDECHQFGTQKRTNTILKFHPRYIVALSATFERSDGFHKVIEEVCGTEKIVKKYEGKFKVFRFSTGIKTEIVAGTMGADWQKLREDVSLNIERNKMILEITKVLLKVEKKVLILTWLNEKHVHVLMDILKKEIESLDYLSGNKKNYKDSKVLVGTIGKIGTGFDEKETCDNFGGIRMNALIIAGSVKSKSLLEQMVGRVFRAENPIVIHLVDNDNISKKHWGKSCRPWYLEAKGEIKNINQINEDMFY